MQLHEYQTNELKHNTYSYVHTYIELPTRASYN